MNYVERADEILRQATAQINELIAEAVAAQAYRDVASLASLAEALSGARRRPELAPVAERANESRRIGTEKKTFKRISVTRPIKLARTNAEKYPHFRREADRLVKVGWSKRDKAAYEHRAPKHVVTSLADAVAARAGTTPFTMEELLPLKDHSGNELPSYQAYVALAWLRSVGIVQKVGKNAYSAEPELISPESIERYLEAVPRK